ncbi:MAG TPA: hypothetical protein PLM22_10475 [Candidatus Sabulitectum sp.]|nr:hypothetical protein [Candidatus Sabulitectum sp.]
MRLTFMILGVFVLGALAQVPTYEDYWYVYADGARIDLPMATQPRL